ncbi:hypothetical protein POM88_015853 [Heracleum sosnowskyi]|uniref:Uncharacterized protein n=1 Tax=Heracleum sosnowskyi TaxID=360622 RepID=A0AAD8MSF5_9APIA|nr:hypothetical protein POM88_015853 [Heracleum sosnowskyi]
MGKKKPAKGNSSKKKQKNQTEYDRLIQSVTDAEVADFSCEIPSDNVLDSLEFPNVFLNPPPLEGFLEHVAMGKWGLEWLTLLVDRDRDIDFRMLSKEEQQDRIDQMVEDMRNIKRQLKWKKYQYALQKRGRGSAAGRVENFGEEEGGSAAGREENFGEEEGEASGSAARREEDIGEEEGGEASALPDPSIKILFKSLETMFLYDVVQQ